MIKPLEENVGEKLIMNPHNDVLDIMLKAQGTKAKIKNKRHYIKLKIFCRAK